MKIKVMPCIISAFPETFGATLVVHLQKSIIRIKRIAILLQRILKIT